MRRFQLKIFKSAGYVALKMQGVDSSFAFGASGFETHAAVLFAARMNHRPGDSVCYLPPCSDTVAV
ncbi:hypothetical protein [Ligilactobacillus ruminis]|uniref:hypothetical protein n=1 Tax=Ligilactobacillus ruminis TaxID=1623 RepID=UPI003D0298DD